MPDLEADIARWRSHLSSAPALVDRDLDELEGHLRDQIADLMEKGLDREEAFFVAVRRIGRFDELSREYAREHGERMWRQLFGAPDTRESAGLVQAILLGIGAAIATQAARIAANWPAELPDWLALNASFLVAPFLAALFLMRRRAPARVWAVTALPFVALALLVNLYPLAKDTALLVWTHLPVLAWLLLAYPYAGGEVGSHRKRMDFVRFTGEWFVYYVLIALGGGVLIALMMGLLDPTAIDTEQAVAWVLPTGAAGAVLVAAWLVENKQRIIENIAPVLTAVFTPLFAVLTVVAMVAYLARFGVLFERDLIGTFDALLVVVFGLVLYAVSARDPEQGPSLLDRLQLVTVVCALALDLLVAVVMALRIGDLGITPNRAAVLGLNLVLLGALAGIAWHLGRFVTGRGGFHPLERWLTGYLPVVAAWAVVVVVAFPPLFGFA